MRIPIQISAKKQTVSTLALIDSGAEGQFIDINFAKTHQIPLHKLGTPIPVRNVDNTPNARGPITHYAIRRTILEGKTIFARYLATSLGKQTIILGLPWLRRLNPKINWTEGTVEINRVLVAMELARNQATTDTKTLEQQIPAFYHEYLTQFDKKSAERFPISRPYDHEINLDDKFIPSDCKVYPLNPKQTQVMDEFINENLRKGYIRSSQSPQASPFFFVGKKDGDYRACQDYRKVNEHTISNRAPMPRTEDLIDQLRGAKYFTKLDLRSGYNNIRIKDGHQWKAAFKTPRGLFEPNVMFFGLKNSPATFQAFMHDILRMEILEDGVLCYMDDILIYGATLEELRRKTLRVLANLKRNDLYLKPEKCKFETQEVEFLGFIIKPDTLLTDPVKRAGIAEWPTPRTLKQVQSFLGFCNFYRKFVPHFSDIGKPLYSLTRKEAPWNWSDDCQKAFETLKSILAGEPALLIPDKDKPFILETDASKVATGAVLYQANANGELQPCGYISESLNEHEQRYEIYDRELLAIVRALDKWTHCLLGAPHRVIIWCDHKNLSYFRSYQRLSPRQSRWKLFLSQFDLHITHKPGSLMIGSDLLSRRSDHGEEPPEEAILLPDSLFVQAIDLDLATHITTGLTHDTFAKYIRSSLATPPPSPYRNSLQDWRDTDGMLYFKNKVYIPAILTLRRNIVHDFHDLPNAGHPGIFRTLASVREHYYWPGMGVFIKNYVMGCALCQQMKVNTHPTAPPLNPIKADKDALPFQTVSMDFITDLPMSQGYDTLMVVVDHDVTKGIVLIPTVKTIDAIGTAALYHAHIYRRYGLPNRIISDRGPQFSSLVFQTLCSRLGIQSKLSTAYHPQTDGQTERVNQEVEAYLRIFCSNSPNSWVPSLPDIEYAHNSQVHSATKVTPFHALYGYNPRSIPTATESTVLPTLSQRLAHLTSLRKETLAAHELARQHMQRHIKHKFSPFKEGDKVWLEATNLHFPNRPRKFSPKREGPFTIEKVLSPLSYRLKLPSTWKIHPVFHASLLSPHRETDTHGPAFALPPPEIIDNQEEYEVESILAHRNNGTRRRFLVKWLGYPSSENSWLPEAELVRNASDVLIAYKAAKKL